MQLQENVTNLKSDVAQTSQVLKFRTLDISKLKPLIEQTAKPFKVEVYDTNAVKPIASALERQGYSPEMAAKMAGDGLKDQITTYTSTNHTTSCVVSFPANLIPNIPISKFALYQKIYSNTADGREFEKLAAYHEGAHCSEGPLKKELGIEYPRNKVEASLEFAISEARADVISSFFYLRDAYLKGGGGIQTARAAVTNLREHRLLKSSAESELAASLLQHVLEFPRESLKSLDDEQNCFNG